MECEDYTSAATNRNPLLTRQSCSKWAEWIARVLLPLGEGGPKGRMRVDVLPSPAASRHPLPEGEGPREKQVSIFENACIPRSAWISGDSPNVIASQLGTEP